MKSSDLKYTAPPVPRQCRLDTVAACNARCEFCHINKAMDRRGRMPLEMVERALDEVAAWPQPLAEIVPVNYGELFLRGDWLEVLRLAEKKLPHTPIVLPTNGAMVGYEELKALLLVKTLKLVNFSINAFFDESYERLMHLPKETMLRVRQLAARIHQERPDIIVWASMAFSSLWITDLERDRFIASWQDIAVPQINSATFCDGKEKPWHPVSLPCRSIFSDIVLGWDGKIGSCCYDAGLTLDLGHWPKDGSLLELWNGPRLKALRELHNTQRRTEIDLCCSCTFA